MKSFKIENFNPDDWWTWCSNPNNKGNEFSYHHILSIDVVSGIITHKNYYKEELLDEIKTGANMTFVDSFKKIDIKEVPLWVVKRFSPTEIAQYRIKTVGKLTGIVSGVC